MTTNNFKSQIGQDRLVIELLSNKINGYFIDIGAHCPEHLSNTYALEKQFNFNGLGIDIDDQFKNKWLEKRPKTKFIVADALLLNYKNLFLENNVPKIIDYLSLDLEPPQVTLNCLLMLPFDEYQFNVITFETDYYRDKSTQSISRNFLSKNGYILIKELNNQDDVYIHNSLIKNN
jgi:hypothetical protein